MLVTRVYVPWSQPLGLRQREESGGACRGEREAGGGGQGEKECTHAGEKEKESALAPPFICFFLHLGLPYANWA